MPSGWTVYAAAGAVGVLGGALVALATDGPSTLGLVAALVAAALLTAIAVVGWRQRRQRVATGGDGVPSEDIARDTANAAPAPVEVPDAPGATHEEPAFEPEPEPEPIAPEAAVAAAAVVETADLPPATDEQDAPSQPTARESDVPHAPVVEAADAAVAAGVADVTADPAAHEAMVADAPVVEAHAVETPVVETPVVETPVVETPGAPPITDSRPLDEDDWDELARVCGAISSAQLGWMRVDTFSRPWLDERVRPFVDLEPLVGALRERPFSVELRTRLGTFADVLSAVAAYYSENTFPDPLLSETDWRFFDWNELTDAAPGTAVDDLWSARAAHMQGLALLTSDAYEGLRDTAMTESKVRERVKSGTPSRLL